MTWSLSPERVVRSETLLLNAMAAGVPVLNGAPLPLIADPETFDHEALVPDPTVGGWTTAVESLFDPTDDQTRTRRDQRRQAVSEWHTAEMHVTRLEETLRRLARGGSYTIHE